MELSALNTLSNKEQEQFKNVCNKLLSHTYVVRTYYDASRGRVTNPDYTFLSIHHLLVEDYLAFLDWRLHWDQHNGFFQLLHANDTNRVVLSKLQTAVLVALRMIYEEKQREVGLEQDALCMVRDLLEKIVTDYAILPARPNMDEIKKALTLCVKHCIIERIDGRFSAATCKFVILPTILSAVSSERLEQIVISLRKEEEEQEADDEEITESIVD